MLVKIWDAKNPHPIVTSPYLAKNTQNIIVLAQPIKFNINNCPSLWEIRRIDVPIRINDVKNDEIAKRRSSSNASASYDLPKTLRTKLPKKKITRIAGIRRPAVIFIDLAV